MRDAVISGRVPPLIPVTPEIVEVGIHYRAVVLTGCHQDRRPPLPLEIARILRQEADWPAEGFSDGTDPGQVADKT